MKMALYEMAMQVVPVLLIALFIDTRGTDRPTTGAMRRWTEVQDRLYAALGVVAFMASMLVVADIVAAGRVPAAIVIATLSGCMAMLYVRILQRFARDRSQQHDQVSGDR
ncbi:hypothetical protein ABZ356_32065 [Micromonospora zamorensis]|uniref:hypothetical protein n=1 Tax=Micromonospora zamorensis TaxID=709883 RepID=UPI0033DD9FE3